MSFEVPVRFQRPVQIELNEPTPTPAPLRLIERYEDTGLLTITPLTGEIWKINTVFIRLATGATADDRNIYVYYTSARLTAAMPYIWMDAGSTQVESSYGFYSWSVGGSRSSALISGTDRCETRALPDRLLYPDESFCADIANYHAGDTFIMVVTGYRFKGDPTV